MIGDTAEAVRRRLAAFHRAGHQLSHRGVPAAPLRLQADPGRCSKSAGSASPKSLANAEKIKAELARAEAQRQEVLTQANAQANKLIEEARAAAARVQEQETQKAIAAAEQIIAKAREAAAAGSRPHAGGTEARSRPPGGADHRHGHRQGSDRRRTSSAWPRKPHRQLAA